MGLEGQLEADGLVGVIRHEADVQVVVCRLDDGGGARPAQTTPDGGGRDVWPIPQLEEMKCVFVFVCWGKVEGSHYNQYHLLWKSNLQKALRVWSVPCCTAVAFKSAPSLSLHSNMNNLICLSSQPATN